VAVVEVVHQAGQAEAVVVGLMLAGQARLGKDMLGAQGLVALQL
jgi:hypothetical protein